MTTARPGADSTQALRRPALPRCRCLVGLTILFDMQCTDSTLLLGTFASRIVAAHAGRHLGATRGRSSLVTYTSSLHIVGLDALCIARHFLESFESAPHLEGSGRSCRDPGAPPTAVAQRFGGRCVASPPEDEQRAHRWSCEGKGDVQSREGGPPAGAEGERGRGRWTTPRDKSWFTPLAREKSVLGSVGETLVAAFNQHSALASLACWRRSHPTSGGFGGRSLAS